MYHFYLHFLLVFRREFLSLNNLVEDLSHHFTRLLITILNVFGSNSSVVRGFAFFEFVDCGLQLFRRDLWNSCRLFGIVVVHVNAAIVFVFTLFLF